MEPENELDSCERRRRHNGKTHRGLAILSPIKSSYASHCVASSCELNLVDIGTGAGLPGLILAIACPMESHSPHGQRTAIVCLKTRYTPSMYPRDPVTPAKLPL